MYEMYFKCMGVWIKISEHFDTKESAIIKACFIMDNLSSIDEMKFNPVDDPDNITFIGQSLSTRR